MLGVLATTNPISPIDERAKDWTYGPVVYQVFVDRFVPPKSLDEKRRMLPPPRSVKEWSETPKAGRQLPDLGVWSHELEFWGGDIAGLRSKLDYVQGLGADVLYLQPVQAGFTNHKYDATDYLELSPEIGDRASLRELVKDVHRRKMKIMLDGVFNHLGRLNPKLQDAAANPKSPYRDWFFFGKEFPAGYKAWFGVKNLAVLRVENPAVRQYLWEGRDSVVRTYLRDGIDGWRLDVAYELGPEYLARITKVAKQTKRSSVVVGEINGYPADWFPSVDGVFNFFAMAVVRDAFLGTVSGGRAARMLQDSVTDAGIENLLRSWLVMDNHDTPRLASTWPQAAHRHFARSMQFTLPGCPVVYYGSELGMTGSGDPENRAPMRWDLVTDDNADLKSTRELIALRKRLPALRYGDFEALQTDRLLAFTRTTGKIREAVLVVANPTAEPVTETFAIRIGRAMSWGEFADTLSSYRSRAITGLITVQVPPKSVRIMVPITDPINGHSAYRRVP
jgi:glycosidase